MFHDDLTEDFARLDALQADIGMRRPGDYELVRTPEVAEKILDAYWRRNGEEPATYTIDLAKRFFAIAKETKCVDDAACDRLDEMRASLEAHRRDGLTDKNSALIQKVLTPGVWNRVVKLPFAMMTSARRQ
jgi:hypothetical protein